MLLSAAVVSAFLLLAFIILLTRQGAQGPTDEARAGSLDEVAALARDGHRARAVEMYRGLTTCSITEAHDAVDRLARGEPVEAPAARAGPPDPVAQDDAEVVALVQAGQLIPAIKLVRERTGKDLLGAKQVVDALRARLPAGGGLAAPRPPEPPPATGDLSDITALARAGQLIQAIKLHRERTGMGLAESKAAVERLRDGAGGLLPASPAAPTDMSDVAAMARGGELIQAIKLYRERTGLGLAESKAAVERLRDG